MIKTPMIYKLNKYMCQVKKFISKESKENTSIM